MFAAALFLAGMAVGAVAGVALLLWKTIPVLERLYLFRPMRDIFKTPDALGVEYEQCFIDTPDGCRLSAWHVCPPNPRGSILYFHGNTGNLGFLNEILAVLYRHQLQVLAVDYRGYGWSTGSPSEEGLYRDAAATVRYFKRNLAHPGRPLLYWGRSLGSCVAANAAGLIAPQGLILESAFVSKKSLLKYFRRMRFISPFTRCRLATSDYLGDHQFPVLLLHGDRDRTIPYEEGQRLFEQLPGPKQFHCIEGAGHIDTHMKDTDAYMRRILQFVESVRPQQFIEPGLRIQPKG